MDLPTQALSSGSCIDGNTIPLFNFLPGRAAGDGIF